MSGDPVDIQKILQNLGRKSTFSLRAPIPLCPLLPTMSCVVPIFLASSLRSIMLRYRYLLRSSPSRMFFTGFCKLLRSQCSILQTEVPKSGNILESLAGDVLEAQTHLKALGFRPAWWDSMVVRAFCNISRRRYVFSCMGRSRPTPPSRVAMETDD